MNEERIRRLIKIVEESNIAELEITRWGRTIRICKTTSHSDAHVAANAAQTFQAPRTQVEKIAPPNESVQSSETPANSGTNARIEMKAPMVGTFYRAPAPDADPYTEVGKTVKKGDVLCIIEAMKLMNEIESEHDGKIVEILVENGQPVEYNQPLFRIEP